MIGGAGFIGSNFLKLMLDKHSDWCFVNLDSLTYAGNLENLKELEGNPNYVFVKVDITDRIFVAALFKEHVFDYVINFAAKSHVTEALKNRRYFCKQMCLVHNVSG